LFYGRGAYLYLVLLDADTERGLFRVVHFNLSLRGRWAVKLRVF
jgi:hypothetical protein